MHVMLAILKSFVTCNISFLPVAAMRELVFPLLEEQLQRKTVYKLEAANKAIPINAHRNGC